MILLAPTVLYQSAMRHKPNGNHPFILFPIVLEIARFCLRQGIEQVKKLISGVTPRWSQ